MKVELFNDDAEEGYSYFVDIPGYGTYESFQCDDGTILLTEVPPKFHPMTGEPLEYVEETPEKG